MSKTQTEVAFNELLLHLICHRISLASVQLRLAGIEAVLTGDVAIRPSGLNINNEKDLAISDLH